MNLFNEIRIVSCEKVVSDRDLWDLRGLAMTLTSLWDFLLFVGDMLIEKC